VAAAGRLPGKPTWKEQTMANIKRYDPFEDFDDLFRGFFVRPMRLGQELAGSLQVKMDVTRTDDTYTVKAEMPGVKKEDIQVSVDGNQVTVSGEVKKESEQKKGEEVIRSERYYGKVSRSFTLPQDVDEAKVEAKYADGVLNLTLPVKAKAAGARRIAVK
jgi:HSP20 family protein